MQRVTEFSYTVLPPVIQNIFLLFGLYLVIPLVDVPILGLSLSAPLLALVAMNVIFGQRAQETRPNLTPWLIFTYVFWVGLLLSLVVNNLFTPGFTVPQSSLLTLIRYVYWLIAFIVTTWVISVESLSFVQRLTVIMGVGGVALALLRLGEAVLFGRWGAWTSPQLLTQNTYGIHFSMIAPFVVLLPFVVPRQWRIVSIGGVLILLAATAGNGSRSSWVAVGIATIIALGMYALAQPRHISRFAAALGVFASLLIIGISVTPWSVLEPVAARFATFQEIDEDKSFQIRLLMNQKSLLLFETNPLFGIGLDRFREADVALDIPAALSYGNQDYFDQKPSHNSYSSLLAEVGLIGFVPFALLLVALTLRGGLAALHLAQRGELWAIAVYAGFIGMSIHLWTLSSLTDTFPWFMYGLVAGMIERDRATRRETA